MQDRALLLIDGGYLDFYQKSLGSIRLDYGKMAEAICEYFKCELLRCVYFNCLPYQSQTPTQDEIDAYRKKDGFYQRLQKLDRFEVKLGHLAFRGFDEVSKKPVLEQKQVDVLLAVEMVYAAARKSADTIILISGDGDFLPAVQLVKREGLTFCLAHGPMDGTANLTVQQELWETADLRLKLSKEFLEDLQRG